MPLSLTALTESTQKISHDGRLRIVLAIAFLYLSGSLVYHQIASPDKSPAPSNVHLCSVSPRKLVIQSREVLDATTHPVEIPARHVPFFFLPIPINSADKEILMTVKGIGPTLAESIVQHRRHFGSIKSAADLTSIPGIGVKRAASLALFLEFNEVP